VPEKIEDNRGIMNRIKRGRRLAIVDRRFAGASCAPAS
jgi:hypothetical protein